ncbi:MAG TPA: gamma carbonic anhydrase family protein [Polyangiaceae bacterium]|jgi:carbonic anhydrase/acetyltransferase-like protein (isoleucine patch superfamily)
MAIYEYQGIRPVLGSRVFVAPNAAVIGDVHLGDESSVWYGVTVRGDSYPIRVGARTNIQDGSVVHVTGGKAATTIGDDVTIGHLALVHGCTIGNRCLIGMGSVVLDGAEVGDECLVAAGSLVAPRTKIPPRSMVMGRPARAVRALTDADLEMILSAGRVYVEGARTFASDAVKLLAP